MKTKHTHQEGADLLREAYERFQTADHALRIAQELEHLSKRENNND